MQASCLSFGAMRDACCALQIEQIGSENEARYPLQVAQARHDTHCSGKAHEDVRDFFVPVFVSVSPDSAQNNAHYEQAAAHVERGFLAGPTTWIEHFSGTRPGARQSDAAFFKEHSIEAQTRGQLQKSQGQTRITFT
jgi:hypothetical protein